MDTDKAEFICLESAPVWPIQKGKSYQKSSLRSELFSLLGSMSNFQLKGGFYYGERYKEAPHSSASRAARSEPFD
jgi:hypothetical protein